MVAGRGHCNVCARNSNNSADERNFFSLKAVWVAASVPVLAHMTNRIGSSFQAGDSIEQTRRSRRRLFNLQTLRRGQTAVGDQNLDWHAKHADVVKLGNLQGIPSLLICDGQPVTDRTDNSD